jgi:hypothetical protein
MITAGGLADFQLDTHEIVWRSETLDPILRGFWDWGNMAALPQEVQDKIKATTRDNAQPYAPERPVCVFPCHSAGQGREAVAPRAEQARAGDGVQRPLRCRFRRA